MFLGQFHNAKGGPVEGWMFGAEQVLFVLVGRVE